MKYFLTIACSLLLSFSWSQEKYSRIDLEKESFEEFEILKDTLDAYRVYFTGENHMYASFNTTFELKFLKYLYETQGVQHFMFEQSPALGYIIEQVTIKGRAKHKLYLKDKFFDPFYDMIIGIEKFNEGRPEEEMIRFHGIDLERFPYFSIYALNDMVDRKNANFEGGEVFEQIAALYGSDFKDATADQIYKEPKDGTTFNFGEINGIGTLKSIIENSKVHRDSISKVLGEDSTTYYAILDGLEKGIKWYNAELIGDVKSPIIRERFMQKEFEYVYRNAKEGAKFYGQFGRCHLHKNQKAGRCYDYYMNSIANRINDIDSTLKNQVLVIPIFYSESKNFDGSIINDLELKEEFKEEGISYIIDLAYKKGEHSIVGFYNTLPYIIVSNHKKDEFFQYNLKWEDRKTHYHLGFFYGYNIFSKFSGLNYELANKGFGEFDNQPLSFSAAFEMIQLYESHTRFAFTYYSPMYNGDNFKLEGYKFTLGAAYPFGSDFFSMSVGANYGYGMFSLTEKQDNTLPNLFQVSGVQNKVVYKNDYMVVDPFVDLRLTMPIISLNFQAGYGFDLSSKYWKLDSKLKDYKKTSFSSFYFQFGGSFHFGVAQ